MTPSRRQFLITGGAATFGAMGGCTGLPGGDGTPTANPPDGPVATVAIPEASGEATYATMGTGGPVITYFGSWKCPSCASFSTGFLRDIVTEYIEPGRARLRFRGVAYTPSGDPYLGADAPRATRAGLAVWNVEPENYWPYHELVMTEQPPEDETWATTDRVVEFARVAGVGDVQAVRSHVENKQYTQPIQSTTNAAAKAKIQGTPALLIDGETVVPTRDKQRTRDLLNRAADGG